MRCHAALSIPAATANMAVYKRTFLSVGKQNHTQTYLCLAYQVLANESGQILHDQSKATLVVAGCSSTTVRLRNKWEVISSLYAQKPFHH